MKIGAGGQPEDLLKDQDGSETEETGVKAPKLSFSERFEQYWYFYKWQTIIALILVFGIAMALFQLFSGVSPDAYIMYVGPGYLTVAQRDLMVQNAEDYIDDHNGDGKNYLAILDITAVTPEEFPFTAYQANKDAVTRFNLEVTAGEAVIYLVEESFFEELLNFGVLASLADILEPGLVPDDAFSPYGVRVSDLDFFKKPGFAAIPKNTVLCIRESPGADSSNKKRKAFWDSNKTFFANMFAFDRNADPAPQ